MTVLFSMVYIDQVLLKVCDVILGTCQIVFISFKKCGYEVARHSGGLILHVSCAMTNMIYRRTGKFREFAVSGGSQQENFANF